MSNNGSQRAGKHRCALPAGQQWLRSSHHVEQAAAQLNCFDGMLLRSQGRCPWSVKLSDLATLRSLQGGRNIQKPRGTNCLSGKQKSHLTLMHRFVDLTQTELKRGWTWIYIARFTDTVWYSKLPDTIKIAEVLFRNGLKCWQTSLLISNPFRVYFQLKFSTVWWTLATLAVEFLNVLKTTPAKSMDHMTYVWHSCTTLGNLMRR